MNSNGEPELAEVARAIGEPARAAMLAALLSGEALPAGELARRAGVTRATASEHLARLVDSGLLRRRPSGRHRYYALADRSVAGALEALLRISSPRAARRTESSGDRALQFARTCYDHLAGRLGVLLMDTLIARGLLSDDGHQVTRPGEEWLRSFEIDVDVLRHRRRRLARPCLDWSERRDHLAGAVGAAITASLLERRWIVRLDGTRAVRLTLRGREGLYRSLALEVERPH